MLKNLSQLEVTINDKTIRLMTEMDTDVNIVEAALKQFQNFLDQIKEAHQKSQEETAQVGAENKDSEAA